MKRVEALDIAKGFAIICVVLGHVVSRESVPGAEWYMTLKAAIYVFHMPLFMVLSGMALGLSWRSRASWAKVGELVAQRLQLLLVPYFLFGIVVVGGKLIFRQFIHVDYPPESFLVGVINVALYPMHSASIFLWYIQILAMYFLIVPWLLQADAQRTPWALLIIGLILNQFDWPTLLNITGFVRYLPFFAGGILVGQYWMKGISTVWSPRYGVLWCTPFVLATGYSVTVELLPKWFVGALAVPAVLCAAQALQGPAARYLAYFGNNTLSIYLMNTIFIGLSKAFLLTLIPWRDHYFIVYFVVLSGAGLLLPIAIKRLVSRVRPAAAAYI